MTGLRDPIDVERLGALCAQHFAHHAWSSSDLVAGRRLRRLQEGSAAWRTRSAGVGDRRRSMLVDVAVSRHLPGLGRERPSLGRHRDDPAVADPRAAALAAQLGLSATQEREAVRRGGADFSAAVAHEVVGQQLQPDDVVVVRGQYHGGVETDAAGRRYLPVAEPGDMAGRSIGRAWSSTTTVSGPDGTQQQSTVDAGLEIDPRAAAAGPRGRPSPYDTRPAAALLPAGQRPPEETPQQRAERQRQQAARARRQADALVVATALVTSPAARRVVRSSLGL